MLGTRRHARRRAARRGRIPRTRAVPTTPPDRDRQALLYIRLRLLLGDGLGVRGRVPTLSIFRGRSTLPARRPPVPPTAARAVTPSGTAPLPPPAPQLQ